jgi:hypothetical protein
VRFFLPILLLACRGEPEAAAPDEPPALPVLEIVRPERGAFVGDSYAVEGTLTPGDGQLVVFEMNDAPAAEPEPGAFSFSPTVEGAGLQILGFRVEDDLGERAVDGRAVMVGPVREKGTIIRDALALQLGPEMLDDDQPDRDDLASLFDLVVEDPAFANSIVGTTTVREYYTLVVTGFWLGSADVDLVAKDGALGLTVVMYDVDLAFDADLVDLFTVSGTAWADTLTLTMDLGVSVVDGEAVVVALSTDAVMTGFGWECEWVPSWMESYLQEDVQATMEEELEAKSEEMVGELVGQALNGFAADTSFGERDEVHLLMDLADAFVVPEGLVVWLDAMVEARTEAFVLPAKAGSPRTSGEPPILPVATDSPFVAVVDDDFVNQALFGFWHAGDLGGMRMSGTELAILTGGDLPPPLGPVATAEIDLKLPPVLAVPTGEKAFDLMLGELWLTIERSDGAVVATSLNVRAPADLVGTDGGMSMVLEDRPSYLTVYAGMRETPDGLDPGDLASLFRLSTPGLLGRSSDLFPSFPAPEIPIGEMMAIDALEGVVLGVEDFAAESTDEGWLVVTGRTVER